MGKKPDEIEIEIRAKRQVISERIVALEERAGQDVNALRESFQSRANDATERAGAFFKVPESMRDRPYTTLFGAAGLGVALGLVRDRSSRKASSNGRKPQVPEPPEDRLPGLVSSLLGVATITAQDEVRRLVKEGFSQIRPGVNRPETATNVRADPLSGGSVST